MLPVYARELLGNRDNGNTTDYDTTVIRSNIMVTDNAIYFTAVMMVTGTNITVIPWWRWTRLNSESVRWS